MTASLINNDAMQANLGFVVSQTAHVEANVYSIRYPDIQYPALIPVDTSANPWVTSVKFYSMDRVGAAEFINGKADDVPTVGVSMDQHESGVYMGAIGYDYGLEEVNQARMLGINLPGEKAAAARRAYEEFVDNIALNGDATKGMEGLFNYTGVPSASVPADGTGSSALWSAKDGDKILRDVNDLITGVFTATNTVAMADTLILPWTQMNSIASRRLGDTSLTILEFLRQNNVYTAVTGSPLTIRAARGLDTRGAGNTARMIAYRRSPEVLKLHMPMPLRFEPVQMRGFNFIVPGIFRLGGLDIRLPKEVRYADGI